MLKESNDLSDTSFSIDSVDEDIALLGFISDYLTKRGYHATVTELSRESIRSDSKMLPEPEMLRLISSVNDMRGSSGAATGILAEWWKVFWAILKDKTKGKVQQDLEHEVGVNRAKPAFKEFNGMKIGKSSSQNNRKRPSKIPPQLPSQQMDISIRPISLEQYSKHNNSVMGVIDQVQRPVDSKQLLLLRQSLYHEFLKKHTSSQGIQNTTTSNLFPNLAGYFNNIQSPTNYTGLDSTICLNSSSTSTPIDTIASLTDLNTNTNTDSNTPCPENNDLLFDIHREELNFNEFMNDYLI